MIGLALSGGGVRGSYQIGVYYAMKKCRIKINGVSGTSIGAFNGALIAAHQEEELLNFWKEVTVGDILGLDNKLVQKINAFDLDFEFYKLSFDTLKEIFHNKGISTEGLEKVLETYNVESLIRQSDIKFGLTTFRMKDFRPLELFIDDIKNGSLNNYILASCYLPVFKQKKLEDDSYFFDGGIHDNCPINMLLNAGYDKVYAVDLGAIGFRQKVFDKQKVVYINPSKKLSNILSLKKEDIINSIQLGYYDALKILKKYPGEKYIFKKIPRWYIKYIEKKYHLDFSKILNKLEKRMQKEKCTYYTIYSFPKMARRYFNESEKK